MALTKCTECGGKVSTSAETCPHCGARVLTNLATAAEYAGDVADVAGQTASVLADMAWADRLLFLVLFVGIVAGGAHLTPGPLWASIPVWGLVAIIITMLVYVFRLILAAFVGEKVAWVVLLAGLIFLSVYFGPDVVSWLEQTMKR